jgi:hypothetical protein
MKEGNGGCGEKVELIRIAGNGVSCYTAEVEWEMPFARPNDKSRGQAMKKGVTTFSDRNPLSQFGTVEKTRTSTRKPPLGPEPSASTIPPLRHNEEQYACLDVFCQDFLDNGLKKEGCRL